jgi:hypothetical protein
MMALGSAGIFTLRYPENAVTKEYEQLVAALLA